MALIFMDSFDLYSANTDLLLGRWHTYSGVAAVSLAAGRYSGQALVLSATSNASITKALPSTYSTLIMGFGAKTNFVASSFTYVTFYDAIGGTAQTTVAIQSDGSIVVKRGSTAGTTLGTSAVGVIASNTWAHVEIKILFATTAVGTYEVRVNGTNVLSGTGATTAASTASIAVFVLGNTSASITSYWDDLYVLDSSTSANNTFLGDSRIETVMGSGDTATKGFGTSVSYVGTITTGSLVSVGANALTLLQVIPAVSGSLSSVTMNVSAAGGSATAKAKGVVYADSGGNPSTRLAVSSEVVGMPGGADATFTFSSPASLTAGSTYYIGWICDTSLNVTTTATPGTMYSKSAQSESTGPSDPAPASMSTTTGNVSRMYGTLTSVATNYSSVRDTVQDGDLSYVQSSTASSEDLYSHTALSSTPASVSAVQITSLLRKADAGPRSVSNQCKSGSTDQAGTTWYPGASYQYYADIYATDPSSGAAWTGAGVNAATIGIKIVS